VTRRVADKTSLGNVVNPILYDLNDRNPGVGPSRKDSGKIGDAGPRVRESHVRDGNLMAVNPFKSADHCILSKVIPVI
jgi:hypothetical protein